MSIGRKASLVTAIIQGKTSIVEEWVEEGCKGLENALRAKPVGYKERYERQSKELQEAYAKTCWSKRKPFLRAALDAVLKLAIDTITAADACG